MIMMLILMGITINVYYYIILIPLHEAGHLLFGILTGYRFISFRIMKTTWIINDNKLSRYRNSFCRTDGQCIMSPPEAADENHPFILYILGGVIIDMSMSIILCHAAISIEKYSGGAALMVFLLSVCEILNALVNGIPMRLMGVDADGKTALLLRKNKQERICWFTNAKIFYEVIKEKTYGDFPEKLFELTDGADLSNDNAAHLKITQVYYYMDNDRWDRALECLESMEGSCNKEEQKYIIPEKLFIHIKRRSDLSVIEDLYRIIKKEKIFHIRNIHIARTRLAYEIYKKKDTEYIQRVITYTEDLIKSHPYKGEAVFCHRLIKGLIGQD